MKLTLEQYCMLSVLHANTMPADALATLGASASTGMVLTPKSWNMPSPASESIIGPQGIIHVLTTQHDQMLFLEGLYLIIILNVRNGKRINKYHQM